MAMRVLVVDDDPIVLEVTRERLRAAGHEVLLRDTPVGTAALVLSGNIDIILLDVLMPGLRGDDLARLLKRHPSTARTAILLHSSLSGDELRPMVMTTGALGAMEKSASSSEFHLEFARYVRRLTELRDVRKPETSEEASIPPPSSAAPSAPSSRLQIKGGLGPAVARLEKLLGRG